ncbi:MAG: hypothetical protein HOW97_08065 [Catenulispora sp.]|nr:hypothetical protein [Catenulispora sp.]
MAHVCPRCGESHQVRDLPGYWRSLAPGAADYEPLRQPAAAEVQYLWALGVAALGVVLLVTGAVVPGLLALAGGVGWGVVMSRQVAVADAAREAWERAMWCGHCSLRFDPKTA